MSGKQMETELEKELEARLKSVELAATLESGALIDVRDNGKAKWVGPVQFEMLRDDSSFPIGVRNVEGFDHYYRHCRRHEVPGLVVTFQPWSGGEMPVSSDADVLCRKRGGDLMAAKANCFRWYHCGTGSDIVGWCKLELPAQGGC